MSRILIITPAGQDSRSGNRVTANRWAKMLRSLGHQVSLAQTFSNQKCDLMIALHAKRSASAVHQLKKVAPETPVILMLTGTDLYRDIHRSALARRTVEAADRLVTLQDCGGDELPATAGDKVRVIYQSAEAPTKPLPPLPDVLEICVAGHLRPVKDPFRTEMATRDLPPESRIRVTHVGEALSEQMLKQATKAAANNPRYHWLGNQTRPRTQQLMSRSCAVVVSSRMEGGANVISEALMVGVPILASRVSGNVGMLGADYAGYFEVGNTQQLRTLLLKLESDNKFLPKLKQQCKSRAALMTSGKEIAALKRLLAELNLPRPH